MSLVGNSATSTEVIDRSQTTISPGSTTNGRAHADAAGSPEGAHTFTARAVLSNTGAQLIAHPVGLVASIGTSAVLSRYLGPADFGQYALVFSYVGLVTTIVADWGLGPIVARQASQAPDELEPILATATLVQGLAAVLGYLALVGVAFAFIGGRNPVGLMIAGLVLLPMPLDTLAIVLVVRLQLRILAWIGVATAVARLALIGGMVALGAEFTALIVATTLATALRYLLLVPVLRKSLRWPRLQIEVRRLRPLLIESWPVALTTTLMAALTQLPIILLDRLSTPDEVGFLSAGLRIVLHVGVPIGILTTTIFPVFARLAANDRIELGRLLGSTLRYLFVIAIPLAALGVIVGPLLMPALYGQSFAPASAAFAILMVQAAVLYPGTLTAYTLVALGRQRTVLMAVGAGAILVVCGCFALDPTLGSVGSAWSLLVGFGTATIWMVIALHREVPGALSVRASTLLVAACALIATAAVANLALPLPTATLLGVAVYLATLVKLGGIDRADGYAVRDLIHIRSRAARP